MTNSSLTLPPDLFSLCNLLQWIMAFAEAMDSMTKVAVRYDMKANRMMIQEERNLPREIQSYFLSAQ